MSQKIQMVTKRLDWYKNKLNSTFGGVKVFTIDGYYVFIAEKRQKTVPPKREKAAKALQKITAQIYKIKRSPIMKLVVTDETLITHQTIRLKLLDDFPDCKIYNFTSKEELIPRIHDADAVFINRVAIPRQVMEQCPKLKYIGLFATGYNGVDIKAAKERGITVCNVPEYSSYAVAQHTMALLLEIVNRVSVYSPMVKQGGWNDQNIISVPLTELFGKTVGIIGCGSIGMAFAKMAQAMGMKVLAHRRTPNPSDETESFRYVDLPTLYRNSDVISIHCPLTDKTRGMINRSALSQMKDGTILLNTARGPILNEKDVLEALESKKLYMVGLDVLAKEPPSPDHPLVLHPRSVVTPHVAWSPLETRQRLIDITIENFYAYLNGHPQNVV